MDQLQHQHHQQHQYHAPLSRRRPICRWHMAGEQDADKVQRLQAQLDELQAEYDEFVSSSKELEEEMEAELSAADKRARDLSSRLAVAERRADQAEAMLSEVSQRAEATEKLLRQDLGNVSEREQMLMTERRRLEQRVDESEEQLRRAQFCAQDLQEKLDSTTEKLVEMTTLHELHENEADEVIQHLRQEVNDLKDELRCRQHRSSVATRGDVTPQRSNGQSVAVVPNGAQSPGSEGAESFTTAATTMHNESQPVSPVSSRSSRSSSSSSRFRSPWKWSFRRSKQRASGASSTSLSDAVPSSASTGSLSPGQT